VGLKNRAEFVEVQQPGLLDGGLVGEDGLPVDRPAGAQLLRQVILELLVKSPVT
jgi:hypothetical protein